MNKINDFIRRIHRAIKPFCDLCDDISKPLNTLLVLIGVAMALYPIVVQLSPIWAAVIAL